MSYWYVVKVLPGKEKQIQEQFNKEIELGEFKYIKRFVCPTETNTVVVRNKKTTRETVIYTGYLYFETENKLTEGELRFVGGNSMIMGILGDRKPVLLNPNDVRKIIKDEKLEVHNQNKKRIFAVGEEIKIVDGAFKGFTGTVLEIKGEMVNIEVKIFGVGSKVNMNKNDINKL